MELKNVTKNTLYADDIDVHYPYTGEVFSVEPDTIKKSKCLRSFIVGGLLEIINYDPSERIEASLFYLHSQAKESGHTPSSHHKIQEPAIKEEPDYPIVPLEKPSNDIEVKIHGIFFDSGGYAKVNRNLAIKLAEAGVKVRVDPKRSQNELRESDLAQIKSLLNTPLSKKHIVIDSIIPSFADYSTGAYRILYTTIEAYTIPQQFVDCCGLYDEVWCTSYWSADILRNRINKPVYVVPAGSDPEHYCEEGAKFDFSPNIKKFVFISVFGWSYRKGYDVLLKAYFDAFDASDDVSLLICSRYQTGTTRFHRNKIKDDINQLMRHFPNKDLPHVVRYSQVVPEAHMPQLYRAAHCFVLPSRGEGSALPPVEASLCGLPVIMTNVSGQSMYLREDNAYLVEMDRLETVTPGTLHIHYWDGQKFPALTDEKVIKQLGNHMRYVFTHYTEAKAKNKKLQSLIKQNFTWNHTANAAIARLQQIKREKMW